MWWSGGTPGKWVSWAGTTPLRAGGTRAGRPGAPGRPSGFPRQSKRHCDNRGKGGPRQVLVRAAARSKAGVLPQTVAPTVTPSAGRFHRQRRTSRLDRRRGFVPGRAAAFVFPRTTQGGGFSSGVTRRQPLFGQPSRAGVFLFNGGKVLFPGAGRLPVFPGGVIQPVPNDGTAPGFSSPARPGSSPFCWGDSPNHPRVWWSLFHPLDEASAWIIPSRWREL